VSHGRAAARPAIDEQAIARAYRMGQVPQGDVHRLLCENSVDQRMLELLHGKRLAFDEYARRSWAPNALSRLSRILAGANRGSAAGQQSGLAFTAIQALNVAGQSNLQSTSGRKYDTL
jgi:hypothetical protein